MIKKTFFISIVSLCIVSSLLGQRHGHKHHRSGKLSEKMMSKKIAFITSYLELTPTEAEKFWPLYNGMHDELEQLRSTSRLDEDEIDKMSEADASSFVDKSIETKEKEVQIRKKYVVKFKDIIPSKKIVKLGNVENKFKRDILSDIRDRFKDHSRKKKD